MLTVLVASAVALADPIAPACSVVLPRYTVDGKAVGGGGPMITLKVGEQTALVTAHNLFGPNGGLAAQLGPDEVVARVTALTAYDVDGKTVCGRATRALKVEGALASAAGDSSHDVAVFLPTVSSGLEADRVMSKSLVPLALAATPPKVGDPVWLGFPVAGVPSHAAKIVELQAGVMYVEYTKTDLDVRGTVGAPFLDAAGAVVGMSIGAGKMPDGALIGSGVPHAALTDRVTAALATK